jgi:hypothetical protein
VQNYSKNWICEVKIRRGLKCRNEHFRPLSIFFETQSYKGHKSYVSFVTCVKLKTLPKSRQHIYTRPKLNNRANGMVEFKNIQWFADKRLCPEFVALQNIRFAVRGGEHHDRYFFEHRVVVHVPQNVNATDTRHIQIQKDNGNFVQYSRIEER